MILNKMKNGAYGEKYRFQFSSLTWLIIYSAIFIIMGIPGLLFKPLILAIWILVIIIGDFLFLVLSRTLLLYEDGFIVTRLTSSAEKLSKLPYQKFINVYVNIRVVRGNNYFDFFYFDGNDKKNGLSYKIGDVFKTIKPLLFLQLKGVKIYIDDEVFAKNVFGVKIEDLKTEVVDKKTWYVG
jgi:hypothetical protein